MRRIHHDETAREQLVLDLDEIVRRGAQQMLAQALEAEVRAYLEAAKSERDEHGRALVVRNGYKPRTLRTRMGTLNLLVRQDLRGDVLDLALRPLPAKRDRR